MGRFSVVMLLLVGAACAQDDIPRTASGPSCQDPSQCAIVGCDCADGTVVLAQHCISFHCQTAEDTCPTQCSERGGWTRRDASEYYCASDDACPAITCKCVSGDSFSRGFCNTGVCSETPGEACWGACMDAGGYACGGPGESCAAQECCYSACVDGTCDGPRGEGPPPGR